MEWIAAVTTCKLLMLQVSWAFGAIDHHKSQGLPREQEVGPDWLISAAALLLVMFIRLVVCVHVLSDLYAGRADVLKFD